MTERRISRRWFVGSLAAGLGAAAAAMTVGLRAGQRAPVVTNLSLTLPTLPVALEGLRVCLVADVHAGLGMDGDRMIDVVSSINSLRPDMVVIAGDMVDISRAWVKPYVRAFRDLRSRLGTVVTLGNHDYYTGVDPVIRGVREAGHHLIRDDHVILEHNGAAIIMLGVDDPRVRTFDPPQNRSVRRVASTSPTDGFRILVAHRPAAFDEAARLGVPLTLAGHTHGGQVGLPFGKLTFARLLTPYVMGTYRRGESLLYVTRGIGMGGLPIRIGVSPEIALLTLRSRSGKA